MSSSIYQDNPCTECQPPQRHPGCHAECQLYRSWRNAVMERKTKYWEGRSAEDMLDGMEKTRSKRRNQRRNTR